MKQEHPVYPGGPPCQPNCPGPSSMYHDGYADGYENGERATEAEHKASFDLRWNADMRAIKRWQAAHPGNELVWPDHADLVVWLLEQLKAAAGQLASVVDSGHGTSNPATPSPDDV